jgi:hypothetical protein
VLDLATASTAGARWRPVGARGENLLTSKTAGASASSTAAAVVAS